MTGLAWLVTFGTGFLLGMLAMALLVAASRGDDR